MIRLLPPIPTRTATHGLSGSPSGGHIYLPGWLLFAASWVPRLMPAYMLAVKLDQLRPGKRLTYKTFRRAPRSSAR